MATPYSVGGALATSPMDIDRMMGRGLGLFNWSRFFTERTQAPGAQLVDGGLVALLGGSSIAS